MIKFNPVFALIGALVGAAYVAHKKELFNMYLMPDKYKKIFADAEEKHNLPKGLLGRVAYQESRFRADIISGKTKSSAGAVGIMQIVPRWHPDVDPLNVPEAVNYSAAYLARLHKKFGSWKRALAAYNWGQGNVQRYLAGENLTMPRETRNYVDEITRDIII